MKTLSTGTILIFTILLVFALAASARAKDADTLPLIPEPQTVEIHKGTFSLTPQTRIYTDAASRATGTLLAKRLRESTGYPLKLHRTSFRKSVAKGAILLTAKSADSKLGPEGYELTVSTDSVVIRAPQPAGLFYGAQTLLQMLPPEIFSSNVVDGVSWQLPCAHIQDKPRFKWRGMLLDVARHFFTKQEVERVLDLMALFKLNTLQLHLTDDQGWRIEIKKYPRLTEVGAWRTNCNLWRKPIPGIRAEWMKPSSKVFGPDGRYGGYYTQNDIREIVAYAAARHITIIPEIEMPGHSCAALAAYPQFSCFGGPFTTDAAGGVLHDGIYCAGNDQTYAFLEDVLSEVFKLFPTKYVHIGGDEVKKDTWKKCPKCQARIRKEGLKDEEELQSYFIKRIAKFVNAHGHTLIGWSEILQGGLASNAVVMDWKGGGKEAASEGHDVVMSPVPYCYFDRLQSSDHSLEPPAGGYCPLRRVYSFEPVPKGLAPWNVSHILGGEACVWTEWIASLPHLEYMMFPRLCALAETVWSPKASRNWPDFRKRLQGEEKRLDELGVLYRKDNSIHIGEWSPADLSTNGSTLKWDVTGKFKHEGSYHVIFDYLDGSRALDISRVSLLADGKIIAEDQHDGLAGGRPRNAVYKLPLPAPKAGARYTVQAEVKGHGGTDSTGTVSWVLVPAE